MIYLGWIAINQETIHFNGETFIFLNYSKEYSWFYCKPIWIKYKNHVEFGFELNFIFHKGFKYQIPLNWHKNIGCINENFSLFCICHKNWNFVIMFVEVIKTTISLIEKLEELRYKKILSDCLNSKLNFDEEQHFWIIILRAC